MKKYFIAIDSDGTIRNDEGIISDNTKNIIKDLNKKGNLVVLASSRPRYHLINIANEVDINYIISNNGAEIFDIKNNKVLFSNFIKKDIVNYVYNEVLQYDIRIVLSIDDKEYATKYTVTDEQILINKIEDINIDRVKQILFQSDDVSCLEKLYNIINKCEGITLVNKSRSNQWYSIGDKNTSKGNAIKKLIKILGFQYDDIIAIGNDENDISMFKEATISCAVNNSQDIVKKEANLVIESNNEDGVYKFLSSLE